MNIEPKENLKNPLQECCVLIVGGSGVKSERGGFIIDPPGRRSFVKVTRHAREAQAAGV
ncbi:hypothetical protein ACFLXB_05105 [Chloroflexota bacterium]